VSIVCCLRIHRQACSSCSVFTDFAACSTPPPPHSRHASTLTQSLGRWAAARVCFPPRCRSGIKGISRDVKLPIVPGNRRPSICRIFARNLHSIDPAHAVYDAHPRRCTSHSMRRTDPAKGLREKCDRSKVAGCLGCELGLKVLKPGQLYERLLRQSIIGRCV